MAARPAPSVSILLLAPLAVAWDYRTGGADWGALGLCGAGGQSPVNLPTVARAITGGEEAFFKYPPLDKPTEIYATGTGVAMTLPEEYRAGFALASKNTEVQDLAKPEIVAFRLWQLEFHAPAEHTVAGVRAPLEVQLSHQRVGQEGLAVISLLFESRPGSSNSFLQSVISAGIPAQPWEEEKVTFPGSGGIHGLDIGGLVGAGGFMYYNGSLTTPPCHPKVRWLVRQAAVSASPAQLEAFSEIMQTLAPPTGNAREVPLHPASLEHLVVVTGHDALSGREATPSTQVTYEEEEGPLVSSDDIRNNPKFEVIERTDSDALRAVKAKYKGARLSDNAARVGKSRALREYTEAQKLYDNAPGLVDKINLKWTLVDKENALKAAKVEYSRAQKVLQEAANDAAKFMSEELKNSGQASEGVEEVHGEIADASVLHYIPEVSVPKGMDSSPFTQQVAETSTRISSGRQQRVYRKIASNLHQPAQLSDDVPEVVPPPEAAAEEVLLGLPTRTQGTNLRHARVKAT